MACNTPTPPDPLVTRDELPPQTRRLLELLDAMVTERVTAKATARGNVRFTRREVCEHTRLGATQVQLHLRRLEELEYLLVHRGGRGATMEYELVYAGEGAGAERVRELELGLRWTRGVRLLSHRHQRRAHGRLS